MSVKNSEYKFYDDDINKYIIDIDPNDIDLNYLILSIVHVPRRKSRIFKEYFDVNKRKSGIHVNLDNRITLKKIPNMLINRIIEKYLTDLINIEYIGTDNKEYYYRSLDNIPTDNPNTILENIILYSENGNLYLDETLSIMDRSEINGLILIKHKYDPIAIYIGDELVYKKNDPEIISLVDRIEYNNINGQIVLTSSGVIISDTIEMKMIIIYEPFTIVAYYKPGTRPTKILYINTGINLGSIIDVIDNDNVYLKTTLTKIPDILHDRILVTYPTTQGIYNSFGEILWENPNKYNHTTISVRRSFVLKDYIQILNTSKLWGSKCSFKFMGEEGVDAGGLTNEVFNLISVDIKNNFFRCKESSNGGCYYIPDFDNNSCKNNLNIEQKNCYHEIGKLIGKCIREKYIINISFSHVILALLLGKKINNIYELLDILKLDDALYVNNLINPDHKKRALANPEYFETSSGIIPTEENYDTYLLETIKDYFGFDFINNPIIKTFVDGFHLIIPLNYDVNGTLFNNLTYKELNSLLIGVFSVNNWKKQSRLEYKSQSYNLNLNSHKYPLDVVKAIETYNLFWKIIDEMDENTQKKIIQFQSGLPYVVPNKIYTISIYYISADNLPTAHTCSHQLDLSIFYTEEQMEKKLIQASQEGMIFTIAGGSNNNYYRKYLKYKSKYLNYVKNTI